MSRAFTDRYDTKFIIGGGTTFPGCARLHVSRTCGAHIEAADFPALIAALYETAGLPAPVILERPEVDPEGARGVSVFRVLADPGTVHVGYSTHAAAPLAPGPARLLASVIAAYADVAEAAGEPDPAEVEELAELMDAEMDRRGSGQFGLYPACARIALLWFRDKRQQRENRDG